MYLQSDELAQCPSCERWQAEIAHSSQRVRIGKEYTATEQERDKIYNDQHGYTGNYTLKDVRYRKIKVVVTDYYTCTHCGYKRQSTNTTSEYI